MDLKKIVANVKDALTPIVESLGYELVDVTAGKNYGTENLNVVIYKKGNMGLDDCEKVANAIDPIIDELNPFGEEAFNLNVSSMGLDWKIVTDDDFRRRMGEEIEITLLLPWTKRKSTSEPSSATRPTPSKFRWQTKNINLKEKTWRKWYLS